jgi:Na+/alanine symporter
MIPLVLFFFGIGTLLANVFIGEYMMFAETQRIRENKIKYSREIMIKELGRFIQTITNDKTNLCLLIVDISFLGIIILNFIGFHFLQNIGTILLHP